MDAESVITICAENANDKGEGIVLNIIIDYI